MVAVNASASPHSSVNFTPFGSDALTLAGEEKCAVLFDADLRTPSQVPGKSTAAMLLCSKARSEVLSI
ncbi:MULTISPECIES: hypothetical protein [unclassified Mesorhizobium]|uniref:hypothetical protein n=1 Tax=unclassified Mesorhizobium TaxID=325217 RepID=UPI0033358BF5